MIVLALALNTVEAVALVGVAVALLRLQARMKSLTSRADGALVQMQDWVAEAEELSATLAERLHERPRRSTEKPEPVAAPAASRQRASTPPVLQIPSTQHQPPETQVEVEEDVDQLLVRRVAARRAETPSTDRSLARERSMDPAGVALQRLIWPRDAKGSA